MMANFTEGSAPAVGSSAVGAEITRLTATVERLRDEIQRAHATADARALIELAKGVLIERLGCGPAQAARQLDVLSERVGSTRLEFAADLVNQAAKDEISAAVGEFPRHPKEPDNAVSVSLRVTESGVLAAGDTHRVAQAVLEHAVTPVGATVVAIWSAGNDGTLALRGYAGISRSEAERWHHVPPGVATLAGQALVKRDSLWITDLGAAGLPSIAGPAGGRAVIPIGLGGRLLGVLEVGWPHPIDVQPPQVRRQFEALADLCAHTLESDPVSESAPEEMSSAELIRLADNLFDSVLLLRPRLDVDGRLADFRIDHVNPCFVDPLGRSRDLIQGAALLEAYPTSAGPGHLFERVEHVFVTGESYRADPVMLTELFGRVPQPVSAALSISRQGDAVFVVWRVQDEAARMPALLGHAQRLVGIGGFEENAATGEITWTSQLFTVYGLASASVPIPLAQLPLHVHESEYHAAQRFLRNLLRYRRAASAAFRLIRPDGTVRHVRVVAEPVLDVAGNLLAIRGVYQDASAQHWTEIALSATHDRLAHSEEQTAEQSRLARQLQQAIMPAAQPSIEAFGLRMAVRYRPTEQDHLVGGDWYDVVVLPSKKILVSVGDIAGHGIAAATGMVVLRNALRGLAATGAGPGKMLTWLNLVAHNPADTIFATAICGIYDPATGVLCWARAGHLPPVLVRNGSASALPTLGGMLLGAVSETRYEEAELQLEPDDVLLMYTDGLVERRGRSLDDCTQRLLTLSAGFAGSLDDRLDYLLDNSDADTDDDACVVGIHVGHTDAAP
ncbi:SpoIIE family protein phosphatase [Nocardia tengchongensis]|uniref:SpoIIE family protein phosphatase n=1 Tax=Nocardia tengchongensis TaxID=2055889 RepID=UPI00365FECD7